MNSVIQRLDVIVNEIEALKLLLSANDSEQQKLFQDKTCLIPALFDGFQFKEAAHACYAFLCLKAGSGRSQNVLVKEYLIESNQPHDKSAVDRLRNAVGYLCRTRSLPKPWLDNVGESVSD